MHQGCCALDPCHVTLLDPKLLAWLHEPQLIHQDDKGIDAYTLQASSSYYVASRCVYQFECSP